MRVMIEGDPFAHMNLDKTLWMRNTWPVRWIAHPQGDATPVVIAYRREFRLEAEATFLLHVSADERYQLHLDGGMIGRGPERGDGGHWFYETYEVTLAAGRHALVAGEWRLGQEERAQRGANTGG